MLALVAEMLGNGRGVAGALHAQQRRRIGGSGHDHRTTAVLGAQNVLDEFLDLAAALADQAHNDHIGPGVARHHAQQHGLAHARARKQAQTLAAACKQGVQRLDTGIERLAHRVAVHGIDGVAVQHPGTTASRTGPLSSGIPCESTTRPSRPSPWASAAHPRSG